MPTMYCALCNRPVEATRRIGAGTVLLAVFTAGLSLLAVPFYAKRCSICMSAAVTPAPPDASAGRMSPPLARLAELERRMNLVEGELEAADVALRRLTAERDFYHQLLGEPASREPSGSGEEPRS